MTFDNYEFGAFYDTYITIIQGVYKINLKAKRMPENGLHLYDHWILKRAWDHTEKYITMGKEREKEIFRTC